MPVTAESDATAFDHLRVLFRLRTAPGAGPRLRDAYERVRYDVTRVEGYLGDQLCQSAHDPDEWLITSEWESPAHFDAWEVSPEHREVAAPLLACVVDCESRRFLVRAATAVPRRRDVGDAA